MRPLKRVWRNRPADIPPPDRRLTPSRGLRSSPGPVAIQRRAQAARNARSSATALRIAALVCADVFVLSLDYSVSYFLRSGWNPWHSLATFLTDLVPLGSLPRVEVLFAVLLGLALFRNYGAGPLRQNSRRLFAGSSLGLSMVFWSNIWDGISILGSIGFLLALIVLGASLTIGRSIVQYFVDVVRPTPRSTSRAVVICSDSRAAELRGTSHLRDAARVLVVGFIPPTISASKDALGALDDLPWILDRYAIDTVMIADPLDEDTMLSVLDLCHKTGCTAISASPLLPLGGFIPRVVSRGYIPYVEIYRPSLREHELAVKRVFDIGMSTILLVISSPVLLAVALLIRLTSRGPVIFSQNRIGYAGRPFTMHKFRTMVLDAEAQRAQLEAESLYSDRRVFKMRDDPRVTPIGRILRRTSLDELPQLWDVLRGEMSLVGPRPPLPNEVESYEESHYSRFDMKPGITGPWQVAGRNEVTCFDEIIALDAAYLTDWTIGKDFVLLLKTIPAVITMRGAV